MEVLAGFQECYAGATGIASAIFGPEGIQLREVLSATEGLRSINRTPGVMDARIAVIVQGFLVNVRCEIETGLLTNIVAQGVGAALGDFVALASQAHDAGQKDVAAVLASAALEDAFKRKAESLGLDVENKDLSDVVNALKTKSFFQGAEARIVSLYVTLRNSAMHAEWNKISGPDGASLIGYMKTFLVQRF